MANLQITSNKAKLKKWLANEKEKLNRVRKSNNTRNNNGNLNGSSVKKRRVNTPNEMYRKLVTESNYRLKRSAAYGYRTNPKTNFSNRYNWNGNFYGISLGVPLILTMRNNNGHERYLGHIWVNGVKTKNKRTTGHFQGIQKTVNLNQKIINAMQGNKPKPITNRIKVAPLLLNAVEKHLRGLGYTAMSTSSPYKSMREYFESNPNWVRVGFGGHGFKKNFKSPNLRTPNKSVKSP
jgi:hypothetical protein